ncbi:MAG: ATP-binding protein [Polyangiales bacterium]
MIVAPEGAMGASDKSAIFEKGPVVIFRWRNEAGWPVESVSSNVREVLGYAAEEFLRGRVSYASLIDPLDAARVGDEVRQASEGTVASFEHEPYRLRRGDGATRWFYDYTHVIRAEDGRATHFVGYVFDITSRVLAEAEKQELERRLLHAQKLESLGVLAGGVAHDFNNLLTGILGQVGLLRRELENNESSVERMRRGLDQIESIGQRAADLTRQLLAYSGKGRTIVEPVHLAKLVDEMASILDVARSKKATLVREFAASLPLVQGDRAQLQQVVMNLLTNASEALGDDPGRVTIRIRPERYASDQLAQLFGDGWELEPGQYVTMEVEDTGCGMNDEAQARLFDPFFTTKFAGRGLGMSAVLGIVRSHHGAIRVRSKVGEGTSFFLAFPSSNATVARTSEPKVEGHIDGHGTVLVVDDEAFVRKTLAMLLTSLGFSVIEAENGREAIERFATHRASISLVIMDMTMPELSGVDAMRKMRELDRDVPIALSSGYSDAALKDADVQPTAFLQKPYTLEELERVLRTVIVTRSP